MSINIIERCISSWSSLKNDFKTSKILKLSTGDAGIIFISEILGSRDKTPRMRIISNNNPKYLLFLSIIM